MEKERKHIDCCREKFSECLFDFQTLFSPSYLQSRQVRAVKSGLSDNLVNWLREKPNKMASVSASRLDKLVDYGLPVVIIGPLDWQYIATLYLDFLGRLARSFAYCRKGRP